ncbi:MAG TPA: HAMP domain-containing sensor histidine kinase [Bacteroidia bacterium]|jgi:two-component system phosphate regulon sensor histidine kinase PhoR
MQNRIRLKKAIFEDQMKLSSNYLFIGISSLALLTVLVIQVNWVFQAANEKEKLFNETTDLILTRTTEALLSDREACEKIEASLATDSIFGSVSPLSESDLRKIDSTLVHYMNYYGFRLNYSFEILKPGPFTGRDKPYTKTQGSEPPACYTGELEEEINKSGFELNLHFPGKNEYLRGEMGTLFITSVILILMVLILFWRTVHSLLKEKKISEHTTDFLNNMTHEFKTPLTNIALAGKMINKDSNILQAEKIRHYSGIILQENEKLRLQVEQVLSMTALERGEIPLQKTELDFHLLIHDSLKPISIQIETKQGNLKLKLNASQPVVMGDHVHLSNALCNLVDNSIKYSEAAPDLAIETFNNSHDIVVVVSDKGIGIEKEYQKLIFEKFFRVPTGDIHDVKGFGLGLSYVKKILELHGGTIELESEKGRGTAFKITLPYV